MQLSKIAIVAIAVLFFAGCTQTRPLIYSQNYHDNYPNLVLAQLDNSDTNVDISQIEQLILSDEKPGPGAYAHLGILYLKAGDDKTGFEYLQKEAEIYPEFAHFFEVIKMQYNQKTKAKNEGKTTKKGKK